MIGRLRIAALILLLLAAPTTALACRGAEFEKGLLHRTLPRLTPDQVAVEVVITGRSGEGVLTIEAEVIRVLQGGYDGRRVLIRPEFVTSCDRFEEIGARGIVIGRATQTSGNELVIDPVRAARQVQP